MTSAHGSNSCIVLRIHTINTFASPTTTFHSRSVKHGSKSISQAIVGPRKFIGFGIYLILVFACIGGRHDSDMVLVIAATEKVN